MFQMSDLTDVRYTCKTEGCKYNGWLAWIPFTKIVPTCPECKIENVKIQRSK
jgi:hypothetical protein